jgi:hypothetical protein
MRCCERRVGSEAVKLEYLQLPFGAGYLGDQIWLLQNLTSIEHSRKKDGTDEPNDTGGEEGSWTRSRIREVDL